MQVLDVNGNHWITISSIGVSDNSVNVYNLLYNGITQTTIELIAKYVNKENVYLLWHLLQGKDPLLYHFVDRREHLTQYLPQEIIPEFPKQNIFHMY